MTVVEEPYHETLYEFMALWDVERLERINRDGEAVRNAGYIAGGVNSGGEWLNETWTLKESQYEMGQNPYVREEQKNAALEKAKNMLAAMEGKEFKELTDAELEHMAAQGLIPPLRKI